MAAPIWAPQPGPQKALIDCPIPEVLFGGARGGGKTDGILGKYGVKAMRYGVAFNAVFFRKEMPQQDDLIDRAKQIYLPLGTEWYEQKKQFVFRTGGRVRFRPLENVSDAEKYQGQNLTDAAIEEAGNYESSTPIDRLFGALRSAGGVPVQLILSANPGGVGQLWIKQRFIDPCPTGMKIIERPLSNGKKTKLIYIPSRLEHNQILMKSDPEYIDRLHLVGSEELVKAWVKGDWNVVAGQYFDCWDTDSHVIEPFKVPDHWTRFMSFDWGSARPFSVGWWTIADGNLVNGRHYPSGAMIRYREWYGSSGPDTGLRMSADEIAKGIKEKEKGDRIQYRVGDPACWKVDGGPSVAEMMMRQGVVMRRADNSRLVGWDQVRNRLKGDEAPMLYVFNTCKDFIRIFPSLQHDKDKLEDVETDSEDHIGDETRYACMSRPYTRLSAKVGKMRGANELTLEETFKLCSPKPATLDGRI